jgi:hypothetical protein
MTKGVIALPGAELAAGIYQLIVSEIPVLGGDTRVLTLLEARREDARRGP